VFKWNWCAAYLPKRHPRAWSIFFVMKMDCRAKPGNDRNSCYASSSSGSKCGRNQICAIKVGTTALPMTAVSSTVYCA